MQLFWARTLQEYIFRMSRILVIDDDITIQLTLKRILQKQGYEVAIAADGQEGLERAIALRPAVILCDWMMPGMKGPEVCQRIKELPELFATFFILLTAFDGVEDIVRGLDAGADDFLTKPPDIAELKARIRSGCRSHELKQELQGKTRALEVGLSETADYVRSLFPAPLSGDLAFSWEFLPSARLGGNGLQGYWLDEDTFVVFMLDVTGVGIGTALQAAKVMMALKFQQLADTDFSQPARVLSALNRYLQVDGGDRACSIWYGVYCPSRSTLTYASGGHPPALLVDDRDNIYRLGMQFEAVGLVDEVLYVQETHELAPGNWLYLFSCGILSAERQLEGWGLDEWSDQLGKLHQQESGDCTLPSLLERVRQRRGGVGFDDDASLLQLRFP